jgi:hypothetical protein
VSDYINFYDEHVKPGTIIEGGGIAVVTRVKNEEEVEARCLLTGVTSTWGNHCNVVPVTELAERLAAYGTYREYEVPVFVKVTAMNAQDAVEIARDRIFEVEAASIPKGTADVLEDS